MTNAARPYRQYLLNWYFSKRDVRHLYGKVFDQVEELLRADADTEEQCRALREEIEGVGRPAPQLPTIYYHGGRSYSRDGQNPIRVGREMHDLLQEFLDGDEAIETRDLSKVVNNVSTVINGIEAKLGKDAVTRPARRGDGYFLRVRSKESN